MDPLTPLDTLCRIILRAREYEAQTATDYDGNETADTVDDEDEGTLSVLDDTINDSVEEELQAAFEDLGEDQLAEVIAFCWVGQGTYEAADWDEAMEEAQALVSEGAQGAIAELLDQPMLASVLESGLAAFDLSCDGIGDAQLAAERIERDPLPRPAQITVKRRGRRCRAVAARSPFASPAMSASRDLGRDLVLDGDVRTPAAAVLRAEQAVQALGELVANAVEVGRDDAIGDPAAEVHQAVDRRARRLCLWRTRPAPERTSGSADGGRAWNMVRCAGTWLRSAG